MNSNIINKVLFFGKNVLFVFFSFILFVSYVPPFFRDGSDNYGVKLVFARYPQNITFPSVHVKVGTFLGNESRNFYGMNPPERLIPKWKHFLGSGKTIVTGEEGVEVWYGAGWTGQPLIVSENNNDYLIIGAFDYNLKKIDLKTGKLIWQYKYDDIIKGTGTFCVNKNTDDPEKKYFILQGSRKGFNIPQTPDSVSSYRAISFASGKEIWRMKIKKTESYSSDVDGSALIINDTAYIGLENGLFTVFDANEEVSDNGIKRPEIFKQIPLYNSFDFQKHGGNLVTESSPCRIGDRIYITSGSGHVFGYNMKTNTIDWDFYVGSDLDGTPVATSDNCLIITIEKQYIQGPGGVMKLNPSVNPENAVVWFFPTADIDFADWNGGVIGSASVTDYYVPDKSLCCFSAIDGYLYVVDHKIVEAENENIGPDGKTKYPAPKLLFKYKTGPSISTPLLFNDVLIAAGYSGIYLFGYNDSNKFEQLDFFEGIFEATPVAHEGQLFIASRDGYLYSLGDTMNKLTDTFSLSADYDTIVRKNRNIDYKILIGGAGKILDFINAAGNRITRALSKETITKNSESVMAEHINTGILDHCLKPISEKFSTGLLAVASANKEKKTSNVADLTPDFDTLPVIEENPKENIKIKTEVLKFSSLVQTRSTDNICNELKFKILILNIKAIDALNDLKQINDPATGTDYVSDSAGPYHIIAGSFTIKENAERYFKKISARGFKSSVLGPAKGFYYIPVFSCSTREEAEKMMKKLAVGEFKDAWIMKF